MTAQHKRLDSAMERNLAMVALKIMKLAHTLIIMVGMEENHQQVTTILSQAVIMLASTLQ